VRPQPAGFPRGLFHVRRKFMLLPINSVGVVQKSPLAVTAYTLTTGVLPGEFSYARADSVATVRNSSGKLLAASPNAPRFDYDISGNALGLLIEGSVTNKSTHPNCNPSSATGMTKSGDASATISVVSDSSALAAANLELLCTNGCVYKLDNSSGGSSANVDIPGAVGNTNPHSFSVWARAGSAGAGGALTRSGTSGGTAIITGASYQRYVLANETPSSSGSTLRVRANPGRVVYFILMQTEELPFATSEIIASGSAATRAQDVLTLDLGHIASFCETSGFLALGYRPKGFLSATAQSLLVADDGSDADDTIGIRLSAAGASIEAYVRASGAAQFSDNNADAHVAGVLKAAGILWLPGGAAILSGDVSKPGTYAADPAGITNLNIGARTSGAEPFYGQVTCLKIGMGCTTVQDLAAAIGGP
jgi:hypothetical protein